ncbi:hypothetical protein ANN_06131 [Periplaneta americana]|uniref:Uncharacterized protein n=1 Tax=Periplaneta americana TaxID=6978 RepID=A0ABQ8TCS4_PERAM|nr:hypothetical protein ANN_06131 [Periplaneta americana]
MAGLCEDGNEPPGSLKAICNWLFNDAISTTRLFSVDEIGDSEMIFGEMRPRIRHRLPCIHNTIGENLGKNPTRIFAYSGSTSVLFVQQQSTQTKCGTHDHMVNVVQELCLMELSSVGDRKLQRLGDHRANHTIPPFWFDDRPPLLRHVRPAAGWSVLAL